MDVQKSKILSSQLILTNKPFRLLDLNLFIENTNIEVILPMFFSDNLMRNKCYKKYACVIVYHKRKMLYCLQKFICALYSLHECDDALSYVQDWSLWQGNQTRNPYQRDAFTWIQKTQPEEAAHTAW